MVDIRAMTCEGCKKPTSMDEVRYVPKGKEGRMALCKACMAKLNIKINEPVKAESKPKMGTSGGVSYYCQKCNYRFRSSSDKPVCGYCGSPERIVPA